MYKKLKSSLSLSHTSDIIDNSLYDILGWRVKEEGAMVDLFDCLPQILKTEFARIKKMMKLILLVKEYIN